MIGWQMNKSGTSLICKITFPLVKTYKRGHIAQEEFEKTVATATEVGFSPDAFPVTEGSRKSLLIKKM